MALADELDTLRELHEKGSLTDQEYASAKGATLNRQEVKPTAARRSGSLWGSTVKVVLLLLLLVVVLIWYVAGTKSTTDMLATAVHAPITLTDDVENLPARSAKSLGINVPYGGMVEITLKVVRGNPLDVFVIDADQLQVGQKTNWNNLKSYDEFNALKTTTYRRTGRLNAGQYYVVVRDTSFGILSSSASDVSVKVQLNP